MKKTKESFIHWSEKKEQAGYLRVKILLKLFLILPIMMLRIIAFPVGFFYFVFSKKTRDDSNYFLHRAAPFITNPKTAKKCQSIFRSLRHIVSFALTLIEKMESWGGKFPFKQIYFQDDDINDLIERLENKKGAVLICSHLGNTELLRGLASFNRTGVSRRISVTSIIDTEISAHFTRIIKELNPESAMEIINAKNINPDTVLYLEKKLIDGGLVVIAGDRTQADGNEKTIMIPFLDEEAPFSVGAFYLAALLHMPIYYVFALRRGELSIYPKYDMHVYKNKISTERSKEYSKKERFEYSTLLVRSFAEMLETHCKNHPFQWYNFYNFWSKGA